MKQSNDRGREVFANKLHREMFILIFFASLLPSLVVAVSLFYLIFYIMAEQVGIPETIAYNVIPAARRVVQIILVATPITIMIILFAAHKMTHKIIGPFDRIVRELDDCLDGTRKGPIMLRQKDKFWPLVDRINKLLAQVPGTSK